MESTPIRVGADLRVRPIEIYDQLAALFAYPGEDYAERVRLCAAALATVQVEAAAALEEFHEQVRGHSTVELQEQFIQTFDLNPDGSLELGWHLFGENYDRGTYLVKLRGLLRRFGIAETHELPDHITHALTLLGRMPEAEAEEFAIACVLPALHKVRAAVKKENSFHTLLEAVAALLGSRFASVPLESIPAAPALRVLPCSAGFTPAPDAHSSRETQPCSAGSIPAPDRGELA